MASPEHLAILKSGVQKWNKWRKENPSVIPDLRGANLEIFDLRGANLTGANLQGADFQRVNLQFTDLSKVKSFYKTKLDPDILSEIKTKWPEKLATIWEAEESNWVIDSALLSQIKKPAWHGWPEKEEQGK